MSEPTTAWRENVTEGEEARLARLAEVLADLQRKKGGKDRALHVKVHAGLRAILHVEPGLPAHAAQGLFARPGPHHCYVRFSNGGSRRQPDKAPDLRGLAIKVLGVEGKKELGDATTQDFLFVDNDTLPFRTPEEFVTFLQCAQNEATLPFTLIGKLGFRAFGLLRSLATEIKGKRGSLLDLAYHTVAPLRLGPYAARLHLEPAHHASPHAKAGSDPDYLAQELGPRVRAGGVSFTLSAQLAESEAESVEDVSSRWSTPKLTLARLELVADDPASAAGKRLASFVESLSFDPWHCLTEHRPLGLTMRARKPAYFASTQTRKAAPEPDGSEWSSFDA